MSEDFGSADDVFHSCHRLLGARYDRRKVKHIHWRRSPECDNPVSETRCGHAKAGIAATYLPYRRSR
ncbi:hypothetical protein BKA82DRAFT_1009194 [Pisolithus tinctorius]|uniref:Uncharacterized protein n=1 Tax=Pisolithus tinctorius Marx 270 TaxID=870435 RepID=A0A0C3I7G8_PISTI|nr:hypothetical protein BKA82DRAFT_1009194 [Pisolithus tinctorius]KIN93112.1 hypothetical protein M404DRAFT_1009194 [Pisolithus tinctorius Marx 270]